MGQSTSGRFLRLPDAAQEALVAGARDVEPVTGLTHGFYKYPARFSPVFARAAIKTFTGPGDLILDPHMGGGTVLVEALALGRHAVGVDISALAEFVSNVKTNIYSESELRRLELWAARLPDQVNIYRRSIQCTDYAETGYYRHLDSSRWRLRKAIEHALASAIRLRSDRIQSLARCVVLRTAQWALDGRKKLPSIAEFRRMLVQNAKEMIAGARQLCAIVQPHRGLARIFVLNRSAAGLENDPRVSFLPSPKLVLTSPPYPGVHVLYHRWQVDGRKEAPAPFWIAGKLDGAGSSYYTMGDRKYPDLRTYFNNIQSTMASVAEIADDETIVVQMVAFSERSWQLPRYLETMEEAGLQEMFLLALKGQADGRLWRSVPGRRWYSDQRGATPGSQEVVLIHRKADGAPARRASDAVTARPRPSA
jgi:hypothetical protein